MKPLLILVAGPYRSGMDDQSERIAQNLRRLEAVALDLFRPGHTPLISEWTVRRCSSLAPAVVSLSNVIV